MENLKLLSETLLDNYRITIDMKKECTRVFLDLASPLRAVVAATVSVEEESKATIHAVDIQTSKKCVDVR